MSSEICIACLSDPDQVPQKEWAAFLSAAAHQHPRQSPLFARPEAALGRQPIYVIGRRDGEICAVALISLVPHPLFKMLGRRAFVSAARSVMTRRR